ncbi:putative ZDHHC-type palmitoyltransferase 8 [Xenia sp. Carnegie-2017]|uniref:putative ZDHHC-type palmitoyltransferase 8 n=1 Tax=Xenia sp. Carnegie-2017 TaxID=2897299 RepID=UPI001F03DC07|nr:putative ZDHHC-type palmitoyltransferase 8 [Xenia sp. Carnegie-2017]
MAIVMLLAGGVGIIQFSFIISTIQKAFPGLAKHKAFRQTIRFILVSPIILTVLSAIGLFFLIFLPVKVDKPYTSREGIILIASACYLWLNVAFNYFAAMLKSPGYPSTASEMEENGFKMDEGSVLCCKCDRMKSIDTHHCTTCGTCVTMMCHHCPFTSNCVGLKNYSYFFLFICYSNVGLLFAMYMTYEPFYQCMVPTRDRLDTLSWYHNGVCKKLGDFAILFIPVVFMAMFCGSMFLLQSLLLATNCSTIELLTKMQRSRNLTDFLQFIIKRIFKSKKSRFQVMFWHSREHWWQFLVPAFVPVQHGETLNLVV